MNILKNKYIKLHLVIFIYSLSSVFSKKASNSMSTNGIFTISTLIPLIGLIFIQVIYAVIWQQIIKNISLSAAYVNKSMIMIWTLIWSVILFNEKIQLKNILGTIVILIGIVVINYDKQ